jgi:hypothetical protein
MRKEVILMKYQKPEVRLSTDAIQAIENHTKFVGRYDNPNTNPTKTTPAYEADE